MIEAGSPAHLSFLDVLLEATHAVERRLAEDDTLLLSATEALHEFLQERLPEFPELLGETRCQWHPDQNRFQFHLDVWLPPDLSNMQVFFEM